jgi:hypothetical protein
VSNATDVVVPTGGNNVYKTFVVSPSTTYTLSLYVKALTATTVSINIFDGGTGANTSQAIALTSGWQRVQVSRTSAAGTTAMRITIGAANGTVLCWGAQAEAGAFATSYIPTTTSTVTRSADVATITGSLFSQWYNQPQGTFVVEAITSSRTTSSVTQEAIIDLSSTFRAARGASSIAIGWFLGSSTFMSSGVTAASTVVKTAGGYSAGNNAASTNGAAVTTDAGSTYGTATQMSVGNIGGGSFFNGHIRSIRYVPVRAADFQLQQVTT